MSPNDSPFITRTRSGVASSLLVIGWLETALQALGQRWYHRALHLDGRAFWRWLALNWQRLGAWWLFLGAILTALLLVGALLTWQSPQLVAMKLMNGTAGLWVAGSKVGAVLAAVVMVLALPVLLPALVLSMAIALVLTVGVVAFGPLLVVGLAAFGLLVVIAATRRTGTFLFEFVLESLAHKDGLRSKAHQLREALGFVGASTTAQGQSLPMTAGEYTRMQEANRATLKGGRVFLGFVGGEEFSFRTEKHLFICAAARSGKGRDLIVPNLKRYPASVFVLDPKGENCNETAAAREAMGHTIAAFDPYDLTSQPSARFNPIRTLTGADMVTRADYLAEALIIGPSDHWNDSARGLVRALALHLATAPEAELAGAARDLTTLRVWLTGELNVTLELMTQSPACEGLIARLASAFLSVPPNERGGIVSTARRDTQWLDNPLLARLFTSGAEEVTFEALRDESQRLSVYVCMPGDLSAVYPQVPRLLTTFAMDTMMKELTGRTEPVLFILDELAQLQRLPIVERAFTLGAGYGTQVWAVFQSVEQARKQYQLDSLYGSSGVRCFFNLADPESVEFASKCASAVFTPADIRRMGKFDMLTLLDGENPLLVQRLGAHLPPRV